MQNTINRYITGTDDDNIFFQHLHPLSPEWFLIVSSCVFTVGTISHFINQCLQRVTDINM